MKRTFTLMISALMLASFTGWAQIELPAPSPAGKVYSKVGLTDVEITYSRPKMRDRQIFGQGSDFLVPFGEMWRTGANSGTVLSISDAIKLDGKELAAGEYLILTVPGQSQWEFIFYGDASLGGSIGDYKEEDVAAKVMVVPGKRSEKVEALTFNISDIAADNSSAAIELAWENTSVKVPFAVDYDKKILASIEEHTKVRPANYLAAANYYFSSGKDSKQALKWINMYFAANPEYENQFWNIHLKAQIQKAAGDMKGAKGTAEMSLSKAKAADDDFGYIKRNEDFLASLKGN